MSYSIPGGGSVPYPPGFKFTDPDRDTLGSIISGNSSYTGLFDYIFVLAGIALLIYLIWGGFELMTSVGKPEAMNQARGRITHAVVGFIIIFAAYWIVQLLEYILGATILGT